PAQALPAATRAEPDAPGHLFTHAPRGGVAGGVTADDRGDRRGGGLPQSVRVFECVHEMDWLAAIRISAKKTNVTIPGAILPGANPGRAHGRSAGECRVWLW